MNSVSRVIQDCRQAMFRPPGDRWEREKLFSRVRNYSIRTQYFSWNIAAPLALYLFGDSDLNHFIKEDKQYFNILFHLLQIISMTFYFIASLIDPGYIDKVPNNQYGNCNDNIHHHHHHHNSSGGGLEEEEIGLLSANSASTSGILSPSNSSNTGKNNENKRLNNNSNNNVSIEMTAPAGGLVGVKKATSIVQGSLGKKGIKKNKIIEKVFSDPIFVNTDNPPGNFCFRCEFIRPIRSKHCYDCDRCVMKFDHHCPMVANCVGGKNHRFFLAFITFETITVFWCFLMALKTLFKLNLIFGRYVCCV